MWIKWAPRCVLAHCIICNWVDNSEKNIIKWPIGGFLIWVWKRLEMPVVMGAHEKQNTKNAWLGQVWMIDYRLSLITRKKRWNKFSMRTLAMADFMNAITLIFIASKSSNFSVDTKSTFASRCTFTSCAIISTMWYKLIYSVCEYWVRVHASIFLSLFIDKMEWNTWSPTTGYSVQVLAVCSRPS